LSKVTQTQLVSQLLYKLLLQTTVTLIKLHKKLHINLNVH